MKKSIILTFEMMDFGLFHLPKASVALLKFGFLVILFAKSYSIP